VGAIGYGVNLAVYATLIHFGLHYLLAATCSFLVAVTSNYTWNRFWTFQGLESAIFVGLAVGLLAFSVWWVRHRVA
jgi:putative flippase GtrA